MLSDGHDDDDYDDDDDVVVVDDDKQWRKETNLPPQQCFDMELRICRRFLRLSSLGLMFQLDFY